MLNKCIITRVFSLEFSVALLSERYSIVKRRIFTYNVFSMLSAKSSDIAIRMQQEGSINIFINIFQAAHNTVWQLTITAKLHFNKKIRFVVKRSLF